MKVVQTTPGAVTVEVTPTEYDAIASALGETLEALEDWEFATRTGVERATMNTLLAAFREQDPYPLTETEADRSSSDSAESDYESP